MVPVRMGEATVGKAGSALHGVIIDGCNPAIICGLGDEIMLC